MPSRRSSSSEAGASGGARRSEGSAGGSSQGRARAAHHLAAFALRRALSGEAGGGGAALKALTLGSKAAAAAPPAARRAAHALLCGALRHLCVVRAALAQLGNDGTLRAACGGDERLLQVLAYDALFGEGLRTERAAPAERAVAARAEALREAAETALRRVGCSLARVEEALPQVPADLPRYARANFLRRDVLEGGGGGGEGAGGGGFTSAVAALALRSAGAAAGAARDAHLVDVVRIPPGEGAELYASELVASGALIQQSKASCMPARALAPLAGWIVVDGCAAPGNKTTHLAALLAEADAATTEGAPKGRVVALDRDASRLGLLRKNVSRVGAGGYVEAHVADFLNPPAAVEALMQRADAVLLDPSCSGSGTGRSRGDFLIAAGRRVLGGGDDESTSTAAGAAADEQRVAKLAAFQLAAVSRALRLPRARRLVYSTCSVHRAENEDVVGAALDVAHRHGWRLAEVLPGWPCRGVGGDWRKLTARAGPSEAEGETDGFFVSLFERDDAGLAVGAKALEGAEAVAPPREAPQPAPEPEPQTAATPAGAKKRKGAGRAGGGKRRKGGGKVPAILR